MLILFKQDFEWSLLWGC